MDFGKSFKQCRIDCGLSQKDVAIKLGVYQSSISDWENNVSRPEYEKLIELSKIYDVSLYELLGIDEDFK